MHANVVSLKKSYDYVYQSLIKKFVQIQNKKAELDTTIIKAYSLH